MNMQNKPSKKVTVKIKPSFFNPKFIPYLYSKNRYLIFYGGAGSGKSVFIATKIILDSYHKQLKTMVIRKTHSTHRESTFAELCKAIKTLHMTNHVTISKTTMKITFHKSGSEIIFKGTDDESKLLSVQGINRCWIEEASEITKEIFNQLELRLRGGGGEKKQFIISFNPISNNHWLKAEFFDVDKPDSTVCHSTYLDNKFLDEPYINTLLDMKERNPEKYMVYALGHWGVLGKQVFTNWVKAKLDEETILRQNPQVKEVIGMDFGFINDASTLVRSLVDLDNRKIYIMNEVYVHGKLNNELAQIIKANDWSTKKITADSSEQKSIAELKSYGIKRIEGAKKGSGSIQFGIAYLQQFEIIISDECKHTIEEFTNYVYKKDSSTGKYIDTPVDAYNHILDALRYSVEPFSQEVKGNKFKTMPKSILGI